jgi:dCTP deaminase
MILSAQSIRKKGLLTPIEDRTEHRGRTYGLSACGYDVRVEFDGTGERNWIVLNPGAFTLASTIERFTMPNDIVGIVHDKSSWARQGLAVQNTVIEPGWSGWLTLELTNHSKTPIKIYRGVGIAQVIFHLLDEPTEQEYDGKYQAQERGPQAAR